MRERIDKYRIVSEIGQGGMSVVFRARDPDLDRDVAVKVLHRHLARDPDARRRFAREAKAVARLRHPNIPEVYGFSEDADDHSFLVTELVEGASLAALLREGTPPLPEIGAMMCLGVAYALEHAHDHAIIHRDVKPENILVGRDGWVKLTDFGIAQIVGLESMTTTGTLVGSPAHMAPEQIEGQVALDARVDVWALGTVLYTAACGGALPFDAQRPHAVLKRIVDGVYADPRRVNPHVGSTLAAIIARCLSVDRDQRFASAREVADALEAWLAARGLVDVPAELSRWMSDRDGYQGALVGRLVTALMAMAEQALSAGRRHQALEGFGRVLTLDPDDAEAARRVRELGAGIGRRRRLRRAGVTLAAAGAIGAVGLGAWWAWPEPARTPPMDGSVLAALAAAPRAPALQPRPPAPPPPDLGRVTGAALREEGLVTGVAHAKAAAAAVARAEAANRAAQPRDRAPDGGAVAAVARKVPVRFTLVPPAVVATVRGQRVRSREVIALPPGGHRVRLTHDDCGGCLPRTKRIQVPDAPAGGGPAEQRLVFDFVYEPFKVRARCGAGVVKLDGETIGNCGETISVRMAGDPKPRLARLTWEQSDGSVGSKKISLRPGGSVTLK